MQACYRGAWASRRLRPRARAADAARRPDCAAGARASQLAFGLYQLAVDIGADITRGAAQQPRLACRQVIGHLGCGGAEAGQVDEVDVGAAPGLEHAAVIEPIPYDGKGGLFQLSAIECDTPPPPPPRKRS